MDADTILNSLLERYRRCRSYQDQGFVKLTNLDEDAATFETIFTRGGQFCFDWKNPNTNFLTFDGRRAYLKEHHKNRRHVRSLSIGVHHSSSGTFGAADYVPFLLMPELLPDRVLISKGPYRLAKPQDWADTNYVLVYEDEGFTKELWLKKSDFALEKVVEAGMTAKDLSHMHYCIESVSEFERYASLPDSKLANQFDKIVVFKQIIFNEETAEMAMKRRRPI